MISPSEKRIRVLLVGNYLPDEQQSMQRYALLLESLLSTKCGLRLIRPKAIFGALPFASRSIRKWLGYVDKYLVFPFVLITVARTFDVVHICDQANAMYVWVLKGRPHIITCHDVTEIKSALNLDPNHRPGWTGRLYHRLNLRGLARAMRIICVSEATRRELLAFGVIPSSRTCVIDNCTNYPYAPMAEADAWMLLTGLGVPARSRFFLHVGGNQWYKNRIGVLQIFAKLREYADMSDCILIMAGKPLTPELRAELSRLNLGDHVLSLVSIDNESLRALYSTAIMLLFPSLNEGFGWPVVEAQACGCPVITSRLGPLPDVGGSAARYIDPKLIDASATIVRRALTERAAMTSAGFYNADRFRPDGFAKKYYLEYLHIARKMNYIIENAEPAG